MVGVSIYGETTAITGHFKSFLCTCRSRFIRFIVNSIAMAVAEAKPVEKFISCGRTRHRYHSVSGTVRLMVSSMTVHDVSES